MCPLQINGLGEFADGERHNINSNVNPEEALFGSINGKAAKPFQAAGGNGLDPLGFWENDDISIPPNTQINSGKLLGKIMDLANEYIIYALNHKNDFPPDDGNPHILGYPTPPWEQSNDLSDALAQYTGIQASDEKISALNDFFYSIMYGNAQDPNGDGTQNVKDVFAIWGGSNPGDDPLTTIQDLSKKLLEDPYNYLTQVPKLGKALAEYTNSEYDLGKADRLISFFLREKSDLTGDGVIDSQDVIKFWKDLEAPTKGDINEDGNIDQKDIRALISDLTAGDMNNDGKLDEQDYEKLKEILPEYMYGIDPVDGESLRPILKGDLNHNGRVDNNDLELLGKVLKSGDMDDDGKVDYKDLDLLIREVRGGNDRLPPRVRIDLGNDKKADFFINGGKMFQVFDDYIKEVDHLEGIDIKELAKEIKKHNGYAAPSQFEVDINHDGKMDSIFTDNMPVIMENEPQANQNPDQFQNTKPFIRSGEGRYDFAGSENH